MDVVARVPGFNYSKREKVDLFIGKIVPARIIDAEPEPISATGTKRLPSTTVE
jgi:hypothetical protein